MPVRVSPAPDEAAEAIELDLLLEGIHRRYGYDFKDYAPGLVESVVRRRLAEERLPGVTAFLERILRDPQCLERFVVELSGGATSPAWPASFYKAFRAKVVPLLRTYPSVQVWCMGCGRGQDLYS